ncbi:hypothetical protein HDU98_003049, partial [Podochytrium sp. JEL0797]
MLANPSPRASHDASSSELLSRLEAHPTPPLPPSLPAPPHHHHHHVPLSAHPLLQPLPRMQPFSFLSAADPAFAAEAASHQHTDSLCPPFYSPHPSFDIHSYPHLSPPQGPQELPEIAYLLPINHNPVPPLHPTSVHLQLPHSSLLPNNIYMSHLDPKNAPPPRIDLSFAPQRSTNFLTFFDDFSIFNHGNTSNTFSTSSLSNSWSRSSTETSLDASLSPTSTPSPTTATVAQRQQEPSSAKSAACTVSPVTAKPPRSSSMRPKSVSAPTLGTSPTTPDSRPRDFVCATCLGRFLRRQDLSRHEVTHNKVKMFSCPLGCGTSFGRSDALT